MGHLLTSPVETWVSGVEGVHVMEPGDWARKALDIVESETRDLVHPGATSKSETDVEIEPLVEKIGATSIAEIEKMIGELQAAKDLLESEGERVQRETEHYTTLTQMASASVKIISDTVAGWREAGHPVRNHLRSPQFDLTLPPADENARSARTPDQQHALSQRQIRARTRGKQPPEMASGEEQSSATVISSFSAQTLLMPALSEDPTGPTKR
jgi:hypothetical protein